MVRRFAAILMIGATACAGSEAVKQEPCPLGKIFTAAGCLPVPSTRFPGPPDSGTTTTPAPDAGMAAPDSGIQSNAPDAMSSTPDAGDDTKDAGETTMTAVQLTGAWAMQVIGADIVTNTAVGTGNVTVTTLALVELAQSGTELALSTQICAIESTPFRSYTTTYPPAAIAAIPVAQSRASLSAEQIGASYVPDQRVQLLGWRALTNAATEQLPETPDDLRVVDQDRDGLAGVTLEVSGPVSGDIYVAGRSVLDLQGTVESNDRIAGLSRATRAQNTLDASDQLLTSGTLTITRDPDPNKSTFTMVRVPQGVRATCDGLIASRGILFP